MEALLGIPVGLALSTAAGLRVFVPLLLTGLAARAGYLSLTPSMSWLGSDAALLAFGTATVLEVGAYYVPWLDNLLDTVATPAAITAGVITTAAVTPELSPLLRWTLAIVAGGGAAGLVQAGKSWWAPSPSAGWPCSLPSWRRRSSSSCWSSWRGDSGRSFASDRLARPGPSGRARRG